MHMTKMLAGVVEIGLVGLTAYGGLQEVWEGPAAESFKPKPETGAVLPLMVGAYEGPREAS